MAINEAITSGIRPEDIIITLGEHKWKFSEVLRRWDYYKEPTP